ncbi:MAG: hypothetical protein WKF68_00895 [Daejeonella sp.]
MTKEALKQLVNDSVIEIKEALWLAKFFVIETIEIENEDNLADLTKQLLDFLKIESIKSKSLLLEDELFLSSIQNHLQIFLERNKEEDEDDDYFEDEDEGFYSKEELKKLKEVEEKILIQGYSKLLEQLMNLIEAKYQLVFNGFNKLEFQRAKSAFWKIIGLGEYGYYIISPDTKKLLDDVYSDAEPLIRKKVEERELRILPDVLGNFKRWTEFNKHKPNKTNLRDFLKNNNIKLSNANIDKVLSDL